MTGTVQSKQVIRRSELQSLLGCPVYEGIGSTAASFGEAFHAVAADWTGRCVFAPATDTVEHMAATLDEVILRRSWGFPAEAKEDMVALGYRFEATHYPAGETLEGMEITMLTDVGDCVLTGTLDRLDRLGADAALVTDYKTHWSKQDDSWQLRFYASQVCRARPHLRRVVTRADYVRLSDGIVEKEYSRDELRAWWHEIVLPGVEGVLHPGPDPRPVGGASCQYCKHRWDCALSIEPYRHEPRTTEERHAMFAEVIRLEAAAEDRRTALRTAYRDLPGEVVNGLEVGYLPPREAAFRVTNAPGTVRYLMDHEQWKTDALTVDSRKLPARVKRELVEQGLAVEIPPNQADPRFQHRKAK